MFNGKRTDRLWIPSQIKVDPEMGSRVRIRASKFRRSIGNEIIDLIEIAFNALDEHSSHAGAHSVTDRFEGEIFSKPGPVTSGHLQNQRERKRA